MPVEIKNVHSFWLSEFYFIYLLFNKNFSGILIFQLFSRWRSVLSPNFSTWWNTILKTKIENVINETNINFQFNTFSTSFNLFVFLLLEIKFLNNIAYINNGKIFCTTFWAITVGTSLLVEMIVWFPTFFTLIPRIPNIVTFHFKWIEQTLPMNCFDCKFTGYKMNMK